MNIFNIIDCHSVVISNNHNITSKSSFFHILSDQSFEMFPKDNGDATISESFALNL